MIRALSVFALLCVAPLAAVAAPVPATSVHMVLQASEGYHLKPYRDGVMGPWTVGIGHSLSARGESVKDSYTPAEIHAFFLRDLSEARNACRASVRAFDDLPESVQVVTLSLVWCVGPTGFTRFTRFRAALSDRDYAAAARELAASKWASQVSPARVRWSLSLLRSFAPRSTS